MAYATTDEQYGITSALDGYVIESENITDTPQVETVPNQKNQVADEIQYDTRYELRITVRGKTKPAATILAYASNKWAVDSVEEAGSYNGLRRYNITAHRTSLYPGTATTARKQA